MTETPMPENTALDNTVPENTVAMRFGKIRGVGHEVSRITLGTSGMRTYEKAAPLLDLFFSRGGNLLDTAFAYGGGVCEEVLGAWMSRHASGAQPVLIAKGAHPPRCTPSAIAGELSVSLERLGVDKVDFYLLHRDDESIPVDEWVDALEAEVRAGRIEAYGGSNWRCARVGQANAYAARTGGQGFTAVSNHFSLATMAEPLYPGCVAVDEADLDWLATSDIALIPWSSQARGFFSAVDPGLLDPNMLRCWDTPANRERRARAEALARTLGVETINVALAYVLAQPASTFPIIGPRDVAELSIALGALDVELGTTALRLLSGNN
jgi:aryl-alcohol dehydrogenase-like predicted oxidoreductase